MNGIMKKKTTVAVVLAALVLSVMATSIPMQANAAYKKGLVKKGSKTYYYQKNKKVKKKWKKVKGKYYYFDKKGVAYKNKVVKIKKNYYGFDKRCRNYRKKLVTIKGKKYYFDKKGKAVTGYKVVNYKLYYFGSKGVCNKTLSSKLQAATREGAKMSGLVALVGNPVKKSATFSGCWGTKAGKEAIYTFAHGIKADVFIPADGSDILIIGVE